MTHPRLNQIHQNTESYRKQIIEHKVYSVINNIEDLKVFMKYHVYAVWDFMSLLKSLQNKLTCTSIPWFPVGNPETRFLINEIVVGEEADVDQQGKRKSHFELYLDAMEQIGASATEMHTFITQLQQGKDLAQAFATAQSPTHAIEFVRYTFDTIKSDKNHALAAVFTFGREDLIPGMFMAIINDIYQTEPEKISIFKYYLERHIEVDGDHHSHLALAMTAHLCGDKEQFWAEAEAAVILALQKRIFLWDGVYEEIMHSRKSIH
jgi:hypothetical protein